MIKSKARFQSAGRKPSGFANFSAFEPPRGSNPFRWLASLEGHAEACSVFSTEAIRSIISVPVYKRISLVQGFSMVGNHRPLKSEDGFGPPASSFWGGRLNGSRAPRARAAVPHGA